MESELAAAFVTLLWKGKWGFHCLSGRKRKQSAPWTASARQGSSAFVTLSRSVSGASAATKTTKGTDAVQSPPTTENHQ